MPLNKIEIMDTTLRDGEQTQGVSFSASEKMSIAEMLLKDLKVDRIEVASARVGGGEQESVKKIMQWAEEQGFGSRIEVLGFVDKNQSVDWMLECNATVLNLLAKGSLLHLEKQLGKTAEQHIANIAETVDYAKSHGIKSNVFLEDWSSGMQKSRNYVMKLVSALQELPVERIFLADTLGILAPDETTAFVSEMVKAFPKARFDFHAHNDYGLAGANSLAAAKAGCTGVHTTVNGLGERAGNAHLAEVVALLNDKTRFGCNVDEKVLGKASKVVEAFSGKRVAANKPIIGSTVFTQTAGVHADGDKKAGLYQNPLRPERFGRERQYALGKLSGKASLEQNLQRLGLELDEESKKKVLQKVIELGAMKKVVTTDDLPFIVSDLLATPEQSIVKIERCAISTGLRLKPKAFVQIKANGKKFRESAFGNGGYDAFMNALAKAAKKIGIEMPHLLDFEVGIPPGGKTDALVETTIAWEKAGKSFATMGVDSDQVMAAVKATEKMLNIVAREKRD